MIDFIDLPDFPAPRAPTLYEEGAFFFHIDETVNYIRERAEIGLARVALALELNYQYVMSACAVVSICVLSSGGTTCVARAMIGVESFTGMRTTSEGNSR